MFKEAVGGGARPPEAPAAAAPSGPPRRSPAALRGLADLARAHRLLVIALALAAAVRLVTTLGYRPAVLFKLDSFDYLWGATHLAPDPVNTSGYSLFLRLLLPFHSLALVAVSQHLLGLVLAVLVYAVLLRSGVRQRVAVLASLPVLFGAGQLLLEQLIMADLLAMATMTASLLVLLARQRPSVLRSAVAGLLMGVSVVIRPTALPLIAVLAVYLLIQRRGWRQAGAVLLAGAVPVLGYVAWFAASAGPVNLTNSNGMFLWSRTMSFADCAVIRPPADLRALCPTAQPGVLGQPDPARRPLPKIYLWTHTAWQWQGKPAAVGLVPDTAAFTVASNARAQRFAILAIEAQPLSYARVVASELVHPLLTGTGFDFPVTQPHTASLVPASNRTYALASIRGYAGSTAGIGNDLGHHLGARLDQPYASLIGAYQKIITLPGALVGLLLAAGLAGLLSPRRRNWPAALLWVSAVITIVLPVAEHEYTYRYVVPAIPLACMAAALCFGVPPRAAGASPRP